MPKKYIFTGGACTGKTTLTEAFGKIKYQIIPETCTAMLNEARKNSGATGETLKKIAGTTKFYAELLKRQLKSEKALKDHPAAFLDRGCIDKFAYCRFFDIKPPQGAITAARNNRYNKVFMLDFLPIFESESNKTRWDTPQDALTIHNLLKEAYEEFGYETIRVPPVSIEKRIKFVLSTIDKMK